MTEQNNTTLEVARLNLNEEEGAEVSSACAH